jgi:hypothetical protein
MASTILGDITGGGSQEDLVEELARLRKDIAFLFDNLDHLNVKRLYTEYCDIRSAAGETIIDGPTLYMYDKQATPVLRLKQGYDPVTADFVFNMYNKNGDLRVGLDADTGDYVFTGGVIRTGLATEDRIELSGGKFRGLTSSGQITGLYFDISAVGGGLGYADIKFYHNNNELMVFEDLGAYYKIYPGVDATSMVFGNTGKNVDCMGSWTFMSSVDFLAGSTGLFTDAVANHDHGGAVSPDGGHNHNVE